MLKIYSKAKREMALERRIPKKGISVVLLFFCSAASTISLATFDDENIFMQIKDEGEKEEAPHGRRISQEHTRQKKEIEIGR